jgi:hypothetical protein
MPASTSSRSVSRASARVAPVPITDRAITRSATRAASAAPPPRAAPLARATAPPRAPRVRLVRPTKYWAYEKARKVIEHSYDVAMDVKELTDTP